MNSKFKCFFHWMWKIWTSPDPTICFINNQIWTCPDLNICFVNSKIWTSLVDQFSRRFRQFWMILLGIDPFEFDGGQKCTFPKIGKITQSCLKLSEMARKLIKNVLFLLMGGPPFPHPWKIPWKYIGSLPYCLHNFWGIFIW